MISRYRKTEALRAPKAAKNELELGGRLAPFADRLSLPTRRSTSDYIADALRAAIFDGQFQDGEELNQVELARYFKVSRIPIRESLRRLQAEGLVSNVVHRKAVVIGLSLEEIIEQIEMRAVLEAYLVEVAGPSVTPAGLAKMHAYCDAAEAITDYGPAWVETNWAFHRSIYEAADRPAAILLVEQMQLRVERYVRRAGRHERLRSAAAEHRSIVEALKIGDFAEAAARMRQHIMHTADEVRHHFEQRDLRNA